MSTVELQPTFGLPDKVVELQRRVARLREEQARLDEEIDRSADGMKSGAVVGSKRWHELTEAKQALTRELKVSCEELVGASDQLAQITASNRRIRLSAVFNQMAERRADIVRLVRAAALQLGGLHTDAKEATDLINAGDCVVGPGVTGAFPHERSRLMSLIQPVDCYSEWSDNFESLTLDFVHVLRILPYVQRVRK